VAKVVARVLGRDRQGAAGNPLAGPALRLSRLLLGYGVPFAAFLLAWQIFSYVYGVPALFPPPTTTFRTFMQLLADGSLPRDAAASMARIAIGFLIGSAAGAVLGLLMGSSPVIHALLDPYVNFLRFISAIAWISIFMMWFGIGEVSKVALIVYATTFTVTVNAIAGVRAIARNKVRAALCLGASPRQLFLWVTLPAAVRYILTGMRLSLANAFLVIVAAEMIQADSGIGFVIISARVYLAPDVSFVGMITLGLLGLASDRLLMLVSRLCLGRYHRAN
jgi:NitT/TauT family transport system permease protein